MTIPGRNRYAVVLFSTSIINTDTYRRDVFLLVNKIRRAAGLQPVVWNGSAAKAAQVRAMEIDSVFSHQRPSGQSWSTVLVESKLWPGLAGENISKGYRTPQDIMDGFLNSPPHRRTILNPQFDQLGVGGLVGRDGQFNCAQIFLAD
ncbi:MAG: CAP domain-containing protein [Deltaproteobacteria bacterium]|nr:CAP domain-containing protein [Deltaproteobacteria bacterium]